MRHRWDHDAVSMNMARRRWCLACWAQGSRLGPRSTPWTTRMPDGSVSLNKIPPCPGTPWVRSVDGETVIWRLSYGTQGEGYMIVTPSLVAQFGREHVEDLLKRHNVPPLPEPAWEELTAA